jgi:hypothetical protein
MFLLFSSQKVQYLISPLLISDVLLRLKLKTQIIVVLIVIGLNRCLNELWFGAETRFPIFTDGRALYLGLLCI